MPRNATAIALKCYFSVILFLMLVEVFPVPVALEDTHPIYEKMAIGVALAGCLISLLGIAWPRTQRDKSQQKRATAILDGSVIEQGGLILAAIGMVLIAAAIVASPLFPMGFFTVACCGGFAVAFISQWYLIKRWRTQLRKIAKNGSAAA